ncbi:MAG: TRAP transporter large permease [Amylibacter sp.]
MEVILLFAMVVGLLMIGVPIAVSLGFSSVLFLLWFSDSSLASVAQTLFNAFEGHYTLLAIPFFILASSFMSTGGVARRIINFSIACVGHFHGGLAIAGVFACMLFAALSGSSPATVVAIGSIVIAGMRQVGYTKEFAAGVICNAGTLGILIPPSIVMVVYAAAVEVSVGRMFLAGVIPGLLAGFMLMVAIYVIARIKDMPKGVRASWGERLRTGLEAGWGLFLIIIILGGIYGGIFTPTEAAAVAALYAWAIASFVYKDMGPFTTTPAKAGSAAAILTLGTALLAVPFWFFMEPKAALALGFIMAIGLSFYIARSNNTSTAPADLASDLIRMPIAFWHRDTVDTLFEAGKLTVTLLFVIANALILKHVLTDEQIPQQITEAMLAAGLGPITFLIVVNVILLIGGQFMEPSGLLVIVAPLVFPIAIRLGIDPIHLGIIMVVNMEIGMITPPVGLNLFVTSGVAGMPMMAVVKAALPFLAVLFVFLIMITYIPIISTFLPNLVMGPEIITK